MLKKILISVNHVRSDQIEQKNLGFKLGNTKIQIFTQI